MSGNFITRLLLMSDAAWERHANPWSVWTRIVTCLPLFTLAVWSRAWIGWGAVIPVLISLLWIWLNPRVFPVPKSLDNWASQGVLGERIWLERKRIAIPRRYLVTGRILLLIGTVGLIPYAWGLWAQSLRYVLIGGFLLYAGKLGYFAEMSSLCRAEKAAGGFSRTA